MHHSISPRQEPSLPPTTSCGGCYAVADLVSFITGYVQGPTGAAVTEYAGTTIVLGTTQFSFVSTNLFESNIMANTSFDAPSHFTSPTQVWSIPGYSLAVAGLVDETCSTSLGKMNTTIDAQLIALPSTISGNNEYLESLVQSYASSVGDYHCPAFTANAVTSTMTPTPTTRPLSNSTDPRPGSTAAGTAPSTEASAPVRTMMPQASPSLLPSGPGLGTRIGIGVGAPIGTVIVVLLAIILWRLQWRRRRSVVIDKGLWRRRPKRQWPCLRTKGELEVEEQVLSELEANEMRKKFGAEMPQELLMEERRDVLITGRREVSGGENPLKIQIVAGRRLGE